LHVNDVLVVLRPSGPVDAAARTVLARLDRVYRDVLPTARAFARADASGTHVIAGVAGAPAPDPCRDVAWGQPVGDAGAATDAELEALRADPRAARALLGSWVTVLEEAQGVTLVSSSDLVHTLVRADGPAGTAWATRGLAALVAAGSPLRLALERVPELIAFDYVLGDEELLEGTRVLPEASVVESDRRGVTQRSYWSLDERLAPGPPTDARALRAVVAADVRRLGSVSGAHLALTAGRDSALVASCLQEQGLVIPAFTIGFEGFPDLVGARAVAQACGMEHRTMAGAEGSVDLGRAVRHSAWTEGLDTAWNLVGPGLLWDGPQGVVWVGGNGGEIGRAFYWHDREPGSPHLDELLREARPRAWDAVRPALRLRTEEALEACAVPGRSGPSRLDVLYARGRMRKWLLRSAPRPEARGMTTAFTSPAVVRSQLDIPENPRRSGQVFDEALALASPNLAEVARAAVRSHPRPAPQRRRAFTRLRRPSSPAALDTVLKQLPRDLVTREVMGRLWWRDMLRAAPHDSRAVHLIWNAVAVEALALWLEKSSAQLAASAPRSSAAALA
jgi:hypothetical protein